jgi:hypothetical protein
MEWRPATKQEVLAAIEEDWVGIDPALQVRLSAFLIEPFSASVGRFGAMEGAFVVAQIDRNVVFFDDIEEDFGTATLEDDGTLSNVAAYSNIAVALRELERSNTKGS